MSNHTPGPWVVGGEKLRDPNCIIIHTGKGESIASVWNLMHSDGSEPNTPLEENAALIAAAPALLAACKAMAGWFAMYLEGEGTIRGEQGMDAFQAGLAAINQAETP